MNQGIKVIRSTFKANPAKIGIRVYNRSFGCYLNTTFLSLKSVAGLVIQATGRTEFEDGLGRSFVTDSASALAHWSHVCCKTYVAVSEVWENPICWQGI